MKKIILGMGLLLGSFFFNKSEAQVSFQVNIGGVFSAAISTMPAAPVVVDNDPGYYDQSGYYYYPDINCYYDPTASLYYYMYNSGWFQSNGIPAPYRNYDFNNGRHMMMNQNQMAQRGVSFARGGNNYNRQQPMQQMGGPRIGNNNPQMRDYGNRMAMNSRNQQGGEGRGNMNGNYNRAGNDRGQMGRGDRMERR